MTPHRTDTLGPNLFRPLQLGTIGTLAHRVVLAPLTRGRSNHLKEPTELTAEYYKEWTRTKGSLAISEATHVSAEAGGHELSPGIWTDGQVKGWRKVCFYARVMMFIFRIHSTDRFLAWTR